MTLWQHGFCSQPANKSRENITPGLQADSIRQLLKFISTEVGEHCAILQPEIINNNNFTAQQIFVIVYLVGLHIYYKMIRGPYNIKLDLGNS